MVFLLILLGPNFRNFRNFSGHQLQISPGMPSRASGQKSPVAQSKFQIMTTCVPWHGLLQVPGSLSRNRCLPRIVIISKGVSNDNMIMEERASPYSLAPISIRYCSWELLILRWIVIVRTVATAISALSEHPPTQLSYQKSILAPDDTTSKSPGKTDSHSCPYNPIHVH